MKRRVFVFLMTLILVTGMAQLGAATALAADMWDGSADTSWYNTTDTSFTITTGAELAGLATLVNSGNDFEGKTITLDADIDLGGREWTPIGLSSLFFYYPFNGVFEGNGHTISGLAIGKSDSPDTSRTWLGLFGGFGFDIGENPQSTSIVRNLNLSITGIYSSKSGADVGGLAGAAGGQTIGCSVTGTVSDGNNGCVGLIAGNSEGDITNCHASGSVSGGTDVYAGGVVGSKVGGSLTGCDAVVTVTSVSCAGGLVGSVSGGTFSNCYAAGDVTGGDYAGGLVGSVSECTVSNCYATGDVTGSGAYPGGFAGYIDNTVASVSGCYATGDVTASGGGGCCIGGFVGYTGHALDNCFAMGNVTSTGVGTASMSVNVGGFVGLNEAVITKCFATGSVTGADRSCIGGLVGRNGIDIENGSSSDSYARGAVSGTGSNVYKGALIGYMTASYTAEHCYFDTRDAGMTAGIGYNPNSCVTTGLEPAQMTGSAASGSMTGLDFSTVWTVKANDSKWYFPQLKVFAESTDDAIKAASLASVTLTPFTVSFNSGSGSAVASEYGYYSAVGKPADPTRTGYTFDGWYTTTELASAYDFSTAVTADITLFAKWKINSYTLGYDVNGGSGTAPASVTQDYNTSAAAADGSGITRTGYTFSGWNTKADGSGTAYAAGASFTFTGNTTLYAQWKINSYTLGYDVNGGSGAAPASITQDYNTTVAAADGSGLMRANYTFAGWNTKADGSGTAYAAGASFIFTGSTTLYAQWQYSGVNITAAASNANGSVSGGGTYGAGASVTLTATANAGYYFAGWYEGGALVSASPAYTFTVSGARSLTAQFDSVGIPASISATAASYNKINVSWGAVPGAKGYQLYRAESPAGEYKLIKTLSKTNYVNTGLNTGTTYYYKVKAYIKIGSKKVYGSYFSPASCATLVLGTVTGPITKANDPAAVKITWKAVAGKSKYEVWRSTSPDGGFALVKTVSGVSYKDSGLAPNTTYYYKIRAYRMAGRVKVYGEYSPVVSAKPVLAQVTGAKAARVNASAIKLSWKPVTGRTKYEIWTSDKIDGTYTLLAETASAGFKHQNLTAGVTYCYKIRAYRMAGGVKVYGDYSSAVSAKP